MWTYHFDAPPNPPTHTGRIGEVQEGMEMRVWVSSWNDLETRGQRSDSVISNGFTAPLHVFLAFSNLKRPILLHPTTKS